MEHVTLPFVLVFTLFGPLWWLLIIGASIVVILGLDNDKGWVATLAVVVAALAMTLLGDCQLHLLVLEHPKLISGIAAGYFGGGAIWSVVKWWLFANKRLERYEDKKLVWLKSKGVNDAKIPDSLKEEWTKVLLDDSEWSETRRIYKKVKDPNTGIERENSSLEKFPKLKPIARENKSRIITWMTYWPWSLLWAMLDDLVRTIFKQIQHQLSDYMDRIASHVFRNTEKDLAPPSPPSS